MKELRNEENEEIHLLTILADYSIDIFYVILQRSPLAHFHSFILSLIINFTNELILLSPLKIFLFSFGSFIGIPFLCPELLIL